MSKTKKFPKDELAEAGTVKSEKAEGSKMIKKELKAGTEAHKGVAKKALKLLAKKKEK